MGESAHHRDRQPGGLALHQVARGGQFVGGGHHRRAERIAVRVGAAPQIVQHPHPGGPDGDIGEAGAPRPPEGVADDDADVDAELGAQARPQGACRGVRVLRQQQHRSRGGVGGVHPSRCHHQALPVLHDPQGAAPGHHPHRLPVDRRLAIGGLDHPALGLADDLRGHQQHVAVGELRQAVGGSRRGDQLDEIIAGLHLGHSRQRPHPVSGHPLGAVHARTSSAMASASRTIAAVASRSVIISGTARQRIPAASTPSTASASTESTSQPSSSPEP